MYYGEAQKPTGLETCAPSLGNNWEFTSRGQFRSAPVPPLVAKALSANEMTSPHGFQSHSGPSNRPSLSDFPDKNRTNKNVFTQAIRTVWAKGFLNDVCHSRESIACKPAIPCPPTPTHCCWFLHYRQFSLLTHFQSQTCISGFRSFHTR